MITTTTTATNRDGAHRGRIALERRRLERHNIYNAQSFESTNHISLSTDSL
jgi:hypothetical protein